MEAHAVVALHDLGYAKVPGVELAASPDVVLKPWGRIEGRLLLHGEPAASEKIVYRPHSPPCDNEPRASFRY